MSSRLCLPLVSSQRIRPPLRAAQGGEESARLGVGRWVLNNPSSTSSKSFPSEPVSLSVKWGQLRALLAFWVSSSVQCPCSCSWEPRDASDSQPRPPHPSWLPAAGPPAAPQGFRTSRRPWTTSHRRKPKPSEGHRVGTDQCPGCRLLLRPCSHASSQDLCSPRPPCRGRIWPQELSPPHLHLSRARKGCPARPLRSNPADTTPSPERPSPAPPVRIHAGLQGSHQTLPPPRSLPACSPGSIVAPDSDLRERRLAGDGPAPRRGGSLGTQASACFQRASSGSPRGQSCPGPPGLMLEEGRQPTAGLVHTQRCGRLPAGLTWRKRTPVSVQ